MPDADRPEQAAPRTAPGSTGLGLRRLPGVAAAAIEGFFARRLTQHGAAIAYRALFSLAPLAIVLVSVAGLILRNQEIEEEVIDTIVGWLPVTPDGEQTVEDAILALANPAGVMGFVSLLVFAWAATGMMAALRNGLDAALGDVRGRPIVRAKLVDFILVGAVGVLVLAAVVVTVLVQIVSRFTGVADDVPGGGSSVVDELVRFLVPLATSWAIVTVLYLTVPARQLPFRAAALGASVTAVLHVAISLASAFVYDSIGDLSVVYGSITVVLVFLYSVYLYASAILLGATLAGAWATPPTTADGPPQSLADRLRSAAVGLVRAPDEDEAPADARPRS